MTQPSEPTLTVLTSQRVLDDTMTLLQSHITLHAEGYRCTTPDLWRIILTAVAQQSSIEAACAHLESAPDANTVRGYLTAQWPADAIPLLEQQINAALLAAVPVWLHDAPLALAIDTHDMPYYGKHDPTDSDSWVVRGQAKASTTYHYRCATAYVLVEQARFTLAVVFMRTGDALRDVVERLLTLVRAAGYRIGSLYADKGFCSVAVLRYLQAEQIPTIMAVPIRGKQGGTRALCRGSSSYWARHTFTNQEGDTVTVRIAVVRTIAKRRRKKRAVWCLYVCMGVDYDLQGVRKAYRKRFGIESSYRIAERLRVRTSSRSAGLRVLLIGVALALENTWLAIQWRYLRRPGPGPRRVAREQFRLPRFCAWLVDAITAIYGMLRSLDLRPYQPRAPAQAIL